VPTIAAGWSAAAVILALVACGEVKPRAVEGAREGTPVVVRSSVDRTAAWVGDPVTYTVEIVCAPGYDIIEGDIARERLRLDGLELRTSDIARDARADGGVVYRARFQVASYAPERDSVHIAPLSVRYYQAAGGDAGQRPAGTAEVAGADIVVRSTLPDPVGVQIRTARTPFFLPASLRLVQPLGLTLLALSIGAVVVALAIPAVRSRSPARPEGAQDAPRGDYRTVLEELRRLNGTADPDILRGAFARLDQLLRDRLTDDGIPARALTPDEIDSWSETAADATRRHVAAQVLRDCERIRYGGPGQPLSQTTLFELLDRAAPLVAGIEQAR
jgi:hypothetical protein